GTRRLRSLAEVRRSAGRRRAGDGSSGPGKGTQRCGARDAGAQWAAESAAGDTADADKPGCGDRGGDAVGPADRPGIGEPPRTCRSVGAAGGGAGGDPTGGKRSTVQSQSVRRGELWQYRIHTYDGCLKDVEE